MSRLPSAELAEFVNRTKKNKRLASKKRKAEAFLELVGMKRGEEIVPVEPSSKKIRRELDVCGSDSVSGAGACLGAGQGGWDSLASNTKPRSQAALQHTRNSAPLAKKVESGGYGPSISVDLKSLLPFSRLSGDQGKLEAERPPLFLSDLQELILLALTKNTENWTPRWCKLQRMNKLSGVTLIVLEDVSIQDFLDHPHCFPFLKASFAQCVEMVSPAQHGSSVSGVLSAVPLSIAQMKPFTKSKAVKEKILQLISKPTNSRRSDLKTRDQPSDASVKTKNSLKRLQKSVTVESNEQLGTLESNEQPGIVESNKQPGTLESKEQPGTVESIEQHGIVESNKQLGTLESNEQQQTKESAGESVPKAAEREDEFPRTSLMLSTLQLMFEKYPLPVKTKNGLYSSFVFSKESYSPVTPASPLFGLDCEMVKTEAKDFELSRVSVVNEQHQVVYDELVKPYSTITNYLTRYSGMTEQLLAGVDKRLGDVQRELRELLPSDAILCGQSLWSDLNALQMFHPYVIDTAIIFNQSGSRDVKCGLRKLAFNFLKRTIQASGNGHNPVEDATATLDLVKLKLCKGIEFGNAMLGCRYFPDIKTYFQDPDKSQNVDETFSHLNAPLLAQTSPLLSTRSNGVHPDLQAEGNCATEAESVSVTPSCGGEKCTSEKAVCVDRRTWSVEEGRVCTDASVSSVGQLELNNDRSQGTVQPSLQDVQILQQTNRQRHIFFQQEGCTSMFSLFSILAEMKKSAAVVGSEGLVCGLPCPPGFVALRTIHDRQTVSASLDLSSQHHLTWLQLNAFTRCLAARAQAQLTGEEASAATQECLAQLDGHVEQLVSSLPARALLTVVLGGRQREDQLHSAASFVAVTP